MLLPDQSSGIFSYYKKFYFKHCDPFNLELFQGQGDEIILLKTAQKVAQQIFYIKIDAA
jgi:hypothetical protein